MARASGGRVTPCAPFCLQVALGSIPDDRRVAMHGAVLKVLVTGDLLLMTYD